MVCLPQFLIESRLDIAAYKLVFKEALARISAFSGMCYCSLPASVFLFCTHSDIILRCGIRIITDKLLMAGENSAAVRVQHCRTPARPPARGPGSDFRPHGSMEAPLKKIDRHMDFQRRLQVN